tara:strand:- start:10 stop:489 length:480 start_codon:yes stop_codon:yes gene_type:complete
MRPKPESVLSLDIGHKRIGLAGCDPLGITITRLPALMRKSFEIDLNHIKNHCQERNIKGLIIGIPFDYKGNETKQSNHCYRYGNRLAIALQLPIAWINEHSSTWAAIEKLNLPNDRSGKIDSEAAALLLEQWLNEGPDLSRQHTISSSCKVVSPKFDQG